jgi:hypothetical protein
MALGSFSSGALHEISVEDGDRMLSLDETLFVELSDRHYEAVKIGLGPEMLADAITTMNGEITRKQRFATYDAPTEPESPIVPELTVRRNGDALKFTWPRVTRRLGRRARSTRRSASISQAAASCSTWLERRRTKSSFRPSR